MQSSSIKHCQTLMSFFSDFPDAHCQSTYVPMHVEKSDLSCTNFYKVKTTNRISSSRSITYQTIHTSIQYALKSGAINRHFNNRCMQYIRDLSLHWNRRSGLRNLILVDAHRVEHYNYFEFGKNTEGWGYLAT